MGFTFSNIAKVSAQSAMAVGQAQAGGMGLGQKEANALAVTNLAQRDDGGKTISGLMGGAKQGGRLRGAAFKRDLMDIGQAALVKGPGRGASQSASSGLGGSGSILNKTV